MEGKKKLIWSFVSVLIAVLTVHVVLKQSEELSPAAVLGMLMNASPIWLVLALCLVGLYIYLEGKAILLLLEGAGYHRRNRSGLLYSASDIYFSAITPSASGGQPASAYFMMRDGIPGWVVTVTLLVNLILYTLSIVVIGILCMVLRPGVFLHFRLVSQFLIVIGYVALVGLMIGFMLMLYRPKFLHVIGLFLIRLGRRLHIIRHSFGMRKKLARSMRSFRQCRTQMAGQKTILRKAFVCNFVQRLSQIVITVIMYMACGGAPERALDVWAVQSYVVIGSNCIPIPGAMGISDFLLVDGFKEMLGRSQAFRLELLARSVSFYLCVLLCLLMTAVGYFLGKKLEKSTK